MRTANGIKLVCITTFTLGKIHAFSTAFRQNSPVLPVQDLCKSLSCIRRKSNHHDDSQLSPIRYSNNEFDSKHNKPFRANELQMLKSTSLLAPILSSLLGLGKNYAFVLEKWPIMTKSFTAGFIFGLSDYSAQALEQAKDEKKNWGRIISALLVGLLYFGPAAHAWYDMIFRILPGSSLVSTLQKTALGQALFSPSFTCIFFASSLIQSERFTITNWITKIKTDLPGAWRAGMGFWPLVGLISYSLIPSQWIPLFVNFCSFIWTIYLSIIANKKSGSKA